MNEIFTYLIIFSIVSVSIIIAVYLILKRKEYQKKQDEQSKYPNSFKCLDGHVVRSKGELIIDNYLFLKGLKHQYERKIRTNFGTIKPDWYLPIQHSYIEYWGFSGKRYEQRKKEKLKIYKKAKMKVISINNAMFSDIYNHLDKLLIYQKEKALRRDILFEKKFCPSCGLILDERF